ncbi:unknown [Neodiprion lecontei nucleopolyhedrovirus]|uniref:Uncharacterized protein n=1 Tax=Neodiprion lecontei nucleopolyhedrovirus (strain Canada) TaxID=654906 RepID=Q6JPC7_NPVNC|nr:unknown [Neodiprion lecontei nucleopolyhedrovirus]AAQ99127.1 unknown [Neodiprion lecontei nucleopolyhedrovirus]
MEHGAIVFGALIVSAAIFDTPLLYVILCTLTIVLIYITVMYYYTKDVVDKKITSEDKDDLKKLFDSILQKPPDDSK